MWEPHLKECVKLALTIQLIEHNQLSAEDENEADVVDHNIESSKTHFIVVLLFHAPKHLIGILMNENFCK